MLAELPDHPPTVLVKLEDMVARVGDLIALLECQISACPPPLISWTKDDKEIGPGDKYAMRTVDENVQLGIYDINENDAGTDIFQYCMSNGLYVEVNGSFSHRKGSYKCEVTKAYVT